MDKKVTDLSSGASTPTTNSGSLSMDSSASKKQQSLSKINLLQV